MFLLDGDAYSSAHIKVVIIFVHVGDGLLGAVARRWRCSRDPRNSPANHTDAVWPRHRQPFSQEDFQRSQGPRTSKACKHDSSAGSTDNVAFERANVDGLLFDNGAFRRNTFDDRRDTWTSLGIGISRYLRSLTDSLDSQRRGLVTTALRLLG